MDETSTFRSNGTYLKTNSVERHVDKGPFFRTVFERCIAKDETSNSWSNGTYLRANSVERYVDKGLNFIEFH